MNCQRFVDLLTTDHTARGTPVQRVQLRLHRLVCHRCRAFAQNDAQLQDWLKTWAEGAEPDGARARVGRPRGD